jgi:hypothetical protein
MDYSLMYQEQYFESFEQMEQDLNDAREVAEYEEIKIKSSWIIELLDNFKIRYIGSSMKNKECVNRFQIDLRGIEKINLLRYGSVKTSNKNVVITTFLDEAELIEKIAIDCFLELEKAIETKIPRQDTASTTDELPF